MSTEDEDVVVVGDKKQTPPSIVYMRWSKVLNRWVPCLASDHETIAYKLVK